MSTRTRRAVNPPGAQSNVQKINNSPAFTMKSAIQQNQQSTEEFDK